METVYELKSFNVRLAVDAAPTQRVATFREAWAILRAIYAELDSDQEHFGALFLDSELNVKGYKIFFSGLENRCQISFPIIFRAAILFGASRIIAAHNHPNEGEPKPSFDDKTLTKRLYGFGEEFGIKVVDHIILGQKGYYSFAGERKCAEILGPQLYAAVDMAEQNAKRPSIESPRRHRKQSQKKSALQHKRAQQLPDFMPVVTEVEPLPSRGNKWEKNGL